MIFRRAARLTAPQKRFAVRHLPTENHFYYMLLYNRSLNITTIFFDIRGSDPNVFMPSADGVRCRRRGGAEFSGGAVSCCGMRRGCNKGIAKVRRETARGTCAGDLRGGDCAGPMRREALREGCATKMSVPGGAAPQKRNDPI